MEQTNSNFLTKLFLWWFGIIMVCLIFDNGNDDYARIVDMNYSAKVVDEPGCEGKIIVTERMTFDVHAADKSNGFWELWRELCEDYIDGLKVYYKVNSVKQIMPDGREIVWQESDKLYWDDSDYLSSNKKYGPSKWYHSPGPYSEEERRYESLLFYVDNLYREQITFEIEYEMYNAVFRYNDCSELYICMYSGETIEYLKSFKGEILIPNKDMPSFGNYKATTYGTNKEFFEFNESSSKNHGYYTFSFELDEDDLEFKPYNEYIEFALISYGADKHKFADYASQNEYYYDDVFEELLAEQIHYYNLPKTFEGYKTICLFICIFLSFIVILKRVKGLNSIKKEMSYYSTKKVETIFRDIPSDLDPRFVAALIHCKDKKAENIEDVYSSILLSLARKKYIEIKEFSKEHIAIFLLDDNNKDYCCEPLTPSENIYLNLIKRHINNDFITMKEFQSRISKDYNYMYDFEKQIEKVVVDVGVGLKYFKNANWKELKLKLYNTDTFMGWLCLLSNIFLSETRLDFVFGGLLILGLTIIFSGKYMHKQSYKYALLTELGEEEYNKWRGLYNFLKSDTLINERTYIELPIWEKYLVYATAFGISEKVIKAIKIRCPELETNSSSSVSTTSIIHNSYYRSGKYHSYGKSVSSSIRTSSSGGGHSYGGGGRGGGGGGGGH